MSSLCSAFTPVVPRQDLAFFDSNGRLTFLTQNTQEPTNLSNQQHNKTLVARCVPNGAANAPADRISKRAFDKQNAMHNSYEQKRRNRINEKYAHSPC